MKSIPNGAVDTIITDPPFGINYRPKSGFRCIINDERPFIWWLYDAYRITKDGGALLCFSRWDVQEAFREAIQWAGFEIRSQIIWNKVAHGAGDTKGQFAPQHEVIWFAVKGRYSFPGHRPKSVLTHLKPANQHRIHPTQKPVDLMEELVEYVVPEQGIVVDPFVGSGSTGCGAVSKDRRFIGIEVDPSYCSSARDRIASHVPSGPL